MSATALPETPTSGASDATSVTTYTVSSIGEYVATVLGIRQAWSPHAPCDEIWYRGVHNAEYELVPGAYWRPHCDELSLVLSFRAMVPGLLPHQPEDDWEWYYLMQDYGLPTRLLDWTESPLAALYFALDSHTPGKIPCVWVLDPLALNALSGEVGIMTPLRPGDPVDHWLPHRCRKGGAPCTITAPLPNLLRDNRWPLAVFPRRHNPRIIAQRGTFTVHGVCEVPINKLPVKRPDGAGGVVRILIDPSARAQMVDELWGLGITKTVIFPEPQSLADDLRRMYGVR